MIVNLALPFASAVASALLALATAPGPPRTAEPAPGGMEALPSASARQCPFDCVASLSWDNDCGCDILVSVSDLDDGLCGASCIQQDACDVTLSVIWPAGCNPSSTPLSFGANCGVAGGPTADCPTGCSCNSGGAGVSFTLACGAPCG